MKPYKIINDSMLNMLSHIEENSIDCVITDPPYELGFMGKSWDSTGIAFNPETWEKCFKALKPGGYLLAFGGSRTFHRIACAIEDAGFELRDTIMWLYGSGFPKSHNIGLAVDKLNGVESKVIGSQTKGSSPLPNNHNGTWSDNQKDGTFDIKQAQNEWSGWGTALKPAYEPIIVARKPIKTTVAENVMIYGVGGINIDECRINNSDADAYDLNKRQISKANGAKNNGVFLDGIHNLDAKHGVIEQGRFPANIIHDGSEEVISGFPNTSNNAEKGIYSRLNAERLEYKGNVYDDFGSASRYFYTAKASKKDRDEGSDTLEAVEIRGGGGRVKNGYDDGDEEEKRLKEAARKYGAAKKSKKNTHPTVKPCELMQYLIRLVAPKGATILDPFMGSGSTGKAVMFENRERNADYKFIGVDLEKEYCAIAEMRIDYALNKYEYDFKQELQESKEKGQLNLFDMEENL